MDPLARWTLWHGIDPDPDPAENLDPDPTDQVNHTSQVKKSVLALGI
jgi:hypothetical protein